MAESVVAELVDLLRLERLEDNLFRGQSRDIGTKYVFGGQVLGQALAAAQCTVAWTDPPTRSSRTMAAEASSNPSGNMTFLTLSA